ncbi:hypothetical protein A1O1_09290 [Capronia coronata CBS 617.96]|uniref:SCP domain-containing protein n=1 Tax=Capronia coronata CBS 617.96 TaxID=1182541 RepID=W9XFB6_9EURO|nr:uncharacterized protein A1O1_09290 [Capronia coronata CBS 617.96]EXJ78888.1 hypothetical protein A1O1_09290 [Capronia coronata CBS 617.96]
MKVATSAFVVLAASGHAVASWLDWSDQDVTVTDTLTRTIEYCPCNGEVRVTPVSPAEGVQVYTTTTNAVAPVLTTGPRTITKAGPIVVVYTTEGYLTTKTGIAIELCPTDGAPGETVTKTVWTGAQPTNELAWIDWTDDDAVDGATLTRTHTEFTTVIGPAPTSDEPEPWSDWVATTNSVRTTSTTSGLVGPIGGSTSSLTTSGYSSSSSSSSGFGVGPIGGSITTSSSMSTTSSTSMTSSSGGAVGPIGGSTTASSSLSTTPAASSTSAASTTTGILSPIMQTTSAGTSSTTVAVVTSSTTAAVTTTPVVASTTTSAAASIQTVNVGTDYISGILEAHNIHRANHSAAALTWATNLATIAGETAATCVYAHDVTTGGGGYGQNIGAGYTPLQVPGMIGNDMYNREMPFYPGPYDTNNVDTSNFGNWGHFSQIVWKGTQQVGCATQYCPQGLTNAAFAQYFTVCNYYPPGKFISGNCRP